MNRHETSNTDAGMTLLEVLMGLVILTLLVGMAAVIFPRRSSDAGPGHQRLLAFMQSARTTAMTTGEPIWLAVAHDRAAWGASVEHLAAGTLLDGDGAWLRGAASLLVRTDGVVLGPRLMVATEDGPRPLFVWQPTGVAAP